MRLLTAIILIAILSAIAEWFLPWWMIAVVSFAVMLFMGLKPGKSFLAGFLGIAICWLIAALLHDIPNEHILSTRMASLFHLPGYGLFIAVTVFVGGLIGGLAALAGGLMNRK